MEFAKDDVVANYSRDVADAFTYLVEHPQIHRTACRITITSDWAELGLLSPSAFIEIDEKSPAPPRAVITSTKVSWNSGGGDTDVSRAVIIK